jgi:hypothetical protein
MADDYLACLDSNADLSTPARCARGVSTLLSRERSKSMRDRVADLDHSVELGPLTESGRRVTERDPMMVSEGRPAGVPPLRCAEQVIVEETRRCW